MTEKYRVSQDVVSSEVGNEIVILKNKKVLVLNETSTAILKLIDEGNSFDDIIKNLKMLYDVDEKVLYAGVKDALNIFLKKGIIHKDEGD